MTPEQKRAQQLKSAQAKQVATKTPQPQVQPPNPQVVANKVMSARDKLEKVVKDYLLLLDDKVLEKNKSEARKKQEHFTVGELVKVAEAMDQENMGEGVFAMAITTLRTSLKMRDRINDLEFLIYSALRDIKNVEKKLGNNKDEKPQG